MNRLILIGITILIFARTIEASSIPDVDLRVTVQQKNGGKIDSGYHILELFCFDGECSFSSVSLNQCRISGSGQSAFYPKVEYYTTWDKNLTVRNVSNTLIVRHTGIDFGGEYTTNLHFIYEKPSNGTIIKRLIGFSGGFIKYSFILQQILTIQYVPLPHANQVVILDCGALLPGLDKDKK